MGSLDLVDEAVRAEHAELTADAGGEASDLGFRVGCPFRVEDGAEVAVAESGGGELPARDGLEEIEIRRVSDAECPNAAVPVGDRLGDAVEALGDRRPVVDRGKGVEIVLVGTLRDFGAAVEVGDSLAQRPPGHRALRSILESTEGLEVGSLGDGGFDAEDAAGLVVHLDRVSSDPVPDPCAFDPILEAGDEIAFGLGLRSEPALGGEKSRRTGAGVLAAVLVVIQTGTVHADNTWSVATPGFAGTDYRLRATLGAAASRVCTAALDREEGDVDSLRIGFFSNSNPANYTGSFSFDELRSGGQ
jgi:hypothetical protein